MSAEGLQFVDTNVIVYAHDLSAGEKHTRAKAILYQLWQDQNGSLHLSLIPWPGIVQLLPLSILLIYGE